MYINKITREYSKSINTATYGGPESWVKIAATYEGQLESQDDPKAVSLALQKMATDDVLAQAVELKNKIKGVKAAATPSNTGTQPSTGTETQPKPIH